MQGDKIGQGNSKRKRVLKETIKALTRRRRQRKERKDKEGQLTDVKAVERRHWWHGRVLRYPQEVTQQKKEREKEKLKKKRSEKNKQIESIKELKRYNKDDR